jgi:hypothetical protein
MYSDLHLKQIAVRSLAVGDKLDFQKPKPIKKAKR